MNRKPLIALTALSVAFLAVPAHAQNRGGLDLGVSAGIYMPSSKPIRDAFGNSVLNFGIGPVNGNRPGEGSLSPELSFLAAERNGNRLFLGTFTYGYELHFGVDDNAGALPYARVFGGATYFDYNIGGTSSRRLGWTTGAEVGVVLQKRLRVAARYNTYSRQQGLNFDGVTLVATLSLLRL